MTESEPERQIRLLAAGLGVKMIQEDVIPQVVIELAQEGHAVKAIKELRSATGVSLVAAKRIVDEAAREA